MLKLNNKPLSYDRAFTHADIQYPANWLRLSTLEERNALGITEVSDTPTWDQRFYWGVDNPKDLADLKTQWKAKQSQIADSLLTPSDWRVTRAAELGQAVASTWLTYRGAVRSACNTRQTEINAAKDVPALKELFFGNAEIVKTKEQQKTDTDGKGVVDSDGKAVMETVNDLDSDGKVQMIANPALATAWPTPI